MTHSASNRTSDTVFYSSTDSYIRKNNKASFRTSLDVYSKAETNALIPSVPSVGNGTITITTSGSASGGGNFTVNQSGPTTINISATDTNTTYSAGSGLSLSGTTFSHSDTSSVSNVNNSGNTFIQDITFDTYGHVQSVTSATATGGSTPSLASVLAVGNTTSGSGAINFRSSDSRIFSSANSYLNLESAGAIVLDTGDNATILSGGDITFTPSDKVNIGGNPFLNSFTLSGTSVPYHNVTGNLSHPASGLQDTTLSNSGQGASNLGTLGVDQGGRIVRGEQEETFRFSRTQLLTSFGGGHILITAPGGGKTIVVMDTIFMVEFTAANQTCTSTGNQLIDIRMPSGISGDTGILSTLPASQVARATQVTLSGTSPYYTWIYRDVPTGSSSNAMNRIYRENAAITVHRGSSNINIGTGITAVYVKVKYKVYDSTTF